MSESGKKWDGKSRIPTDTYKKNFDEIFGKKEQLDLPLDDYSPIDLDEETYKRNEALLKGEEKIQNLDGNWGADKD